MSMSPCAESGSARLAPPVRRIRAAHREMPRMALAAVLAATLASCTTTDDTASRKPQPSPGLIAQLQRSGGSAITGAARFQQSEGGVTLAAVLWTGGPGQWRLVLHANGICTSPNAFSAGPPLMLPDSAKPAVIEIFTNSDGVGNAVARIAGLAIDGPASIKGRSVVIHAGLAGSLDAQPDVRNDRVACGVIEVAKPIF